MTYRELYEKADGLLDKGELTLGEYTRMTRPLDREIVEVIPKKEHGEWELVNDDDYWLEYCCTKCHESIVIGNSEIMAKVMYIKPRPTYNFCPHCGADMRGEA